jgi:ubiquinone/menaquinone biosynthesis C-methylase UbiE
MTTDPSDHDVGRFGRWADTYDESVLQRFLFGPLQGSALEQAATLVAAPRAVLDIGCGTGQLLHRAARRFPASTLTGIDASEEMIRVARSSVPEGVPVEFVHGFAEELPFPDATFELVTTTMSFHHWADQPKALREVARVLAPGGVFALADALPVGWLSWLFVHSGDGGRFNTPRVLREMLQGAGLRVDRFAPAPRLGGTVQVVLSRRAAV